MLSLRRLARSETPVDDFTSPKILMIHKLRKCSHVVPGTVKRGMKEHQNTNSSNLDPRDSGRSLMAQLLAGTARPTITPARTPITMAPASLGGSACPNLSGRPRGVETRSGGATKAMPTKARANTARTELERVMSARFC